MVEKRKMLHEVRRLANWLKIFLVPCHQKRQVYLVLEKVCERLSGMPRVAKCEERRLERERKALLQVALRAVGQGQGLLSVQMRFV